jgi:hypothetical protein
MSAAYIQGGSNVNHLASPESIYTVDVETHYTVHRYFYSLQIS